MFFLGTELELLNEVEILHHVLKRQTAAIVKIRGRILDPPQRERLDRAIGGHHHAIDLDWLVEALGHQVVHGVVGVVRGLVAGVAPSFAVEQGRALDLGGRRF